MLTDTHNDIQAKDVKRLLLGVYKKYRKGEINENKAYREAFILNTILRAIELTDLEERLQNIEASLKHED